MNKLPILLSLSLWWLATAPAAQTVPAGEQEAPPAPAAAPATTAPDAAVGAAELVRVDEPGFTAKVRELVAGLESLALIRPEISGAVADLAGLEKLLTDALSGVAGLRLLAPEQVLAAAGPEFAISDQGIAGVAQRCGTAAALFPRVFRTAELYEVQLWLVGADAKRRGELLLGLEKLPAGPEPAEPAATTAAPAAVPPEPAGETASAPSPIADRLEQYRRRELALVLAREPEVGVSVGFATGNVAVGVGGSSGGTGWLITEGGEPISEKRLLELTGEQALMKKFTKQAAAYRVYRNLGIGLALGGFVAAGIAAPFFKQGTDQGLTAAGVVVGVGSAAGAVGLVLWLSYGSRAAALDEPDPRRHYLTPAQAERLVDRANDRLRRELELEQVPEKGGAGAPGARLWLSPIEGGAAGGLWWRF